MNYVQKALSEKLTPMRLEAYVAAGMSVREIAARHFMEDFEVVLLRQRWPINRGNEPPDAVDAIAA